MKTIILCGGIGYRLKEETEFKPKPMVQVGGKPILWHIMKIYAHYGYNDFVLALGYKADYIKDFFLNQKAFTSDFTLETKDHKTKYFLENRSEIDDFRITFVDTGLETNPGERILKCRRYIPERDSSFMVTYGDGVSDINIHELIKYHKKEGTIGTITGIHPRSKFGMVETDGKGKVKNFSEKPIVNDWVNGGYMIFQKAFFDYVRPGETEHPALIKLSSQGQLSLYKHKGFWYCVDTYKELDELNDIWNSGKSPWRVW